jgi:hypothetical protein
VGKHSEVRRAQGLLVAQHSVTPRSAAPFRVRFAQPKRPGNRGRRLFIGAFVMTVGVLLVNIVDPYSGALASPYYQAAPRSTQDSQTVLLAGEYSTTTGRDGYSITDKPAPAVVAAATAPAAGVPDPDSAQAIALGIIGSHGWGSDQYNCLVSLWNRESRWNVYAHNTSSGAYGIPQSLPGEKMASAGADWQTNPTTQIIWGLGYIEGRYGSPCGAWAHSEDRGWY